MPFRATVRKPAKKIARRPKVWYHGARHEFVWDVADGA